VLEAFYQATNGDQWRGNVGWLVAASLSQWRGVTIDSAGRVTKLWVENDYLRGIKAFACCYISYLINYLNEGNIPAEFCQLSNLKLLDLSSNSLSGILFN